MKAGSGGKLLTRLGEMSSRPAAFVIVMVYGVAWAVFDRKTLDLHGVATMITWFMTLFIQRAEHRDTQAIQAKLDEILRVHGEARDEFTELDKKEPEEIETQRREEGGD